MGRPAGGRAGAGPFKLVEIHPGEKLRLDVFSGYWGGQPKLSTLEFYLVPDEAVRVVGLRFGEFLAVAGPIGGVTRLPSSIDFTVCRGESTFHAVIKTLEGFNCFPDGEMRFDDVSGVDTLNIAVPNLDI